MKTWELVKDFQLKFPNLVKDLTDHSHHWDCENINSYHIEAPSTWAHVMMVLLMAEHYNYNFVVRCSALLHDLAKPLFTTRHEEKKKVRMFGHEGGSVFMGLDYLNTLSFLSEDDKIKICQLISFHTYLYQEMKKPNYEIEVAHFFAGEQSLFKDLICLTKCDSLGRFSEDENREPWINDEQTFAPVLHKINPFIYPRKTKGEAIILVGPPLSGKSTWVKNNSKDHLVVCRDDIILKLARTNNYNEAYLSVDHDKVNQQYDLFRKESIQSGNDLIFDLTHLTEKSRRKTLAGLPKQLKRKAIVFLTGYNSLIIRNDIRSQSESKTIPPHVLQTMMGQLSMPLKSEGFDEIEYIFEK